MTCRSTASCVENSVFSGAPNCFHSAAHRVGTAIQHGHVGAHAERDRRRMRADDAAAQDHDLARRHARHAAEQDALAAVRLLEQQRPRLHGHATRHFRHRRQQRQAAARRR